MKIAVIVTDASGLFNAGLDVERTVKAFELSEEMADYIKKNEDTYASISFAILKD